MLKRLIGRIFGESTHGEGDTFYINGAASLPPPLEPGEEAEAIEALPDAAARSTLIEHNLRLVVYIAKKFENSGVGIEDLISIGTIGLIKAVGTYRSDKNIKLATYASRCIENEILMYMRKSSSQRNDISIDEPLNTDWDGNELLLSDIGTPSAFGARGVCVCENPLGIGRKRYLAGHYGGSAPGFVTCHIADGAARLRKLDCMLFFRHSPCAAADSPPCRFAGLLSAEQFYRIDLVLYLSAAQADLSSFCRSAASLPVAAPLCRIFAYRISSP